MVTNRIEPAASDRVDWGEKRPPYCRREVSGGRLGSIGRIGSPASLGCNASIMRRAGTKKAAVAGHTVRAHAPAMIVVTEAEAAAIRAVYQQRQNVR